MKKTLRFITLLISLVMLLGTLASCANSGGSDESTAGPAATAAPGADGSHEVVTTAEETLYAQDDLDETYNFNEVITIYLWSEHRMAEFYTEESGDVIDDSIYKRNNNVSTRLGITFEYVEEPGDSTNMNQWVAKAENDWQADNEYDIYAGYSRAIPLMTLKKMTTNLLEHEAFSVEKPWWPVALTEECTINDKLFFCTGDIATSMLWYMNGLMYNKDLYEAYIGGDKNPMDMVEANEWTIDVFFTLVRDIYTDDGNGKKDELDFYGTTLYSTDVDAFQIAAGITSLEKDEDKGLRISEKWNSQRCADVCELLGGYVASEGVYATTSKSRTVFFDQRSIFHLDRIFIIPGADNTETSNIEFSYGIVPTPKYEASQESFRTNLGNPFTIFAVNAQADNIEAAVTTIEAMGSENHRLVTPAVFEVAMKVRYTDDPQASKMFDILREGVSFDFGKLYGGTFGKATANLFKDTALSGNPAGFLSKLKTSQRVIDNAIKTVMEVYGD